MKNILISLAVILGFASPALSATLTSVNADQYDFNRAAPEMNVKHQLGTIISKRRKYSVKGQYNFTTQGGAISTINFIDPFDGQALKLPKNAVITGCVIDVLTTPTSGGSATIAISSGKTAADLLAATAVASYTGLVACIPIGTAATDIKMTADSTVSLTIATATVTAGKINLLIDYSMSE